MADMTMLSSHQTSVPSGVQAGESATRIAPAASGRNRELYRARASRLADFFPDELVIHERTISVIRRDFLVSFTETLPVRDIGRVVYVESPVFASLEILGKNPSHDLKIRGLNKKQALLAKEIIEGLLLEDAGVVDLPDWVHTDDRRDMLAEAGRNQDHQDELADRASR